jgi:hypothetical protein
VRFGTPCPKSIARDVAVNITNKEHEMEARFLETAWLALATNLNLKPGGIQYIEMRRAFFAGAYTVMGILKAIGQNSDESEEADVDILESMHQECEAFRLDVTHDPNQN